VSSGPRYQMRKSVWGNAAFILIGGGGGLPQPGGTDYKTEGDLVSGG